MPSHFYSTILVSQDATWCIAFEDTSVREIDTGIPDKYSLHDDVIKWKHFPCKWPFVRGIHRSPVNSPHKGQWRGVLMFSLMCARINGWVNNGEAGDLRRHQVHYDVIVMRVFKKNVNQTVCVNRCVTTMRRWKSWVKTISNYCLSGNACSFRCEFDTSTQWNYPRRVIDYSSICFLIFLFWIPFPVALT